MKTITEDELKTILEDHKRWLTNGGGKRANLKGVNLRGTKLIGVDLSEADLSGASLKVADLRGASLRGTDLSGASLIAADLRGTDLRGAFLKGTDLRGADLRGADIAVDDMIVADTIVADIPPDLVTRYFPSACPEEGSFIAWKKCGKYIVKLRIPEDALRTSAFGRKCRASKAECLEIQNMDGTQSGITEVKSNYNKNFVYRVGQMAFVNDFDTNRTKECAPGIHFFIIRQEAVDY